MSRKFRIRFAFVLATAALIAQSAFAQDEPQWKFTEIGGNRIAWSCEGVGEPTIVLIAGIGLDAYDSYGRTYHSYDGPGRICMYDRAGMGASTFPNPETRTLDQLVEELHSLSGQENWGEVVLVAHSFGGFIARAYADKYADEVLGILFLDAAHEDWVLRLQAEMSTEDWAIMDQVIKWNIATFHEDYIQAQEAVRATQLRDDLPITVISRGIPHTQIRLAHMSYDGLDLFESEHQALQLELTKLSLNSEHRIARYSSHLIDNYDPWLIIDEIKQLVGRLPTEEQ